VAAIAADGARSRVGTHRSGTQYLRDALFKGRNIQELSVGDTSVEDTSTLHRTPYVCDRNITMKARIMGLLYLCKIFFVDISFVPART
jgi:hypothetical protein